MKEEFCFLEKEPSFRYTLLMRQPHCLSAPPPLHVAGRIQCWLCYRDAALTLVFFLEPDPPRLCIVLLSFLVSLCQPKTRIMVGWIKVWSRSNSCYWMTSSERRADGGWYGSHGVLVVCSLLLHTLRSLLMATECSLLITWLQLLSRDLLAKEQSRCFEKCLCASPGAQST